MTADREPPVGVVVATRDRAASLLVSLGHLCALPERPPVVVVDNGSSDGTAGLVRRRFPHVDVVALAENLGAGARTVGARRLRTPYVAFSDDDSWWDPGALAGAAAALGAAPRLALVAARVLVGEDGREDPTCAAMAASPLDARGGLPGPAVLGFVACGSVVRRSAYLAVGGFERRLGLMGEERLLAVELAAAGWDLAYLPEVVARHHPSPVRDRGQRRRLEVRNELWFSWLRRPAGGAARATARAAGDALHDRHALAGLAQACAGARWVLRERRPVGPELERQLRAIGA